jgi:hypothetical protein
MSVAALSTGLCSQTFFSVMRSNAAMRFGVLTNNMPLTALAATSPINAAFGS